MGKQPRLENWNSKLGAVLAVAGSAVGFGNFLRFPGLAAQYGGGAFMIAYFIAFLLIGIPLSWVEWALGRRGGALGGRSGASVFMLVTRSHWWKYIGALAVLAPLGIGMYYLYLEGWTLGYAYHMAAGNLDLDSGERYEHFFERFVGLNGDGSIYSAEQCGALLFFLCALGANFYLLYRGVTRGIEWFCKWSMPLLLLTAVIILLRVITLGTPNEAYPTRNSNQGMGYMWNPDKTVLVTTDLATGAEKPLEMVPSHYTAEQEKELLQRVQQETPAAPVVKRHISVLEGLMNPDLWIAAASQIFYSLSIGFGTVLTYATYVAKKEDIALCSLTANTANEVVEVSIAGLMIVPAAVSLLGVAAAACTSTFGLGFNVLPQVFAHMPAGRFFGTLFFALLSLAAVTSSISLIQPAIAFMEEFWALSRTQSVVLATGLISVGCVITTWFTGSGLMALDTLDFWMGNIMLYLISGLYLYIFLGKWGVDNGMKELREGALIPVPQFVRHIIVWITPSLLIIVFISWVYKNIFGEACPQIRNILEGRLGAITPLAWVAFVLVFFLFVAHTSRRFHRNTLLEEQKDRLPFS